MQAERYLRAALIALLILGFTLVAELASSQLRAGPWVHLQSPVDHGWLSSPVGPREGMGGYERFHKGIDLSVPIGTPVKAMADGTVVMHWPPPNGHFKGHPIYGGYVVIKHGRGTGLYSAYAHLSVTYIEGGQWVFAGEVIGLSGDNGLSTGPHLHVEVFVDPMHLIGGDE